MPAAPAIWRTPYFDQSARDACRLMHRRTAPRRATGAETVGILDGMDWSAVDAWGAPASSEGEEHWCSSGAPTSLSPSNPLA